MIHLHLTALVLAIILFIITYNSIDSPDGESKYSKALHMVLRLIYLIILFTGLMLFLDFSSGDQMMYGLKFLAGLITIGLMEMALIKQRKKGDGTQSRHRAGHIPDRDRLPLESIYRLVR